MMRAPVFWRHDSAHNRLAAALLLASWGWRAGGWFRARAQRAGQIKAACPVISIGNLVAGGAGKTPITLALAQLLKGQGYTPHIITRGYGGQMHGPMRVDPAYHSANDVGDEALLLAAIAPTWIAARRKDAAMLAVGAGADLLLLDDAHQHHTLHKDLSILVIDKSYGIGNGRIMPAGPLRERLQNGLGRADAVILMGEGQAPLPFFSCATFAADLRPAHHAPKLQGRRVLAFAGIANPEKFFASLEAAGADIAARLGFADHYVYSAADIDALAQQAVTLKAHAVTTAKDWVRLPQSARAFATVWPVEAQFDDSDALTAFILARLEKAAS